MLAEAKDTSEIMVDLAYAAVYFNDPGMAEELGDLEEQLNDLVQEMRAVCTLAVRRPAEAEGMASVLQVISAIEGIGNAAVDITRIVTHRLGIPNELIADLSRMETGRFGLPDPKGEVNRAMAQALRDGTLKIYGLPAGLPLLARLGTVLAID